MLGYGPFYCLIYGVLKIMRMDCFNQQNQIQSRGCGIRVVLSALSCEALPRLQLIRCLPYSLGIQMLPPLDSLDNSSLPPLDCFCFDLDDKKHPHLVYVGSSTVESSVPSCFSPSPFTSIPRGWVTQLMFSMVAINPSNPDSHLRNGLL